MKKIGYIGLLLVILGVISCGKDFIEPNLEGKTVLLYTPGDVIVTSQFTQTFWWEKLEGADKYRLQIVKATFASPDALILDSAIGSNKFTYSMTPGSYEWRIRAENSSSLSDYTTRSFTIDSTLDLGNQQVVLTTPVNNYVSNQGTVTFKWNSLLNATFYTVRIVDAYQTLITNTVTYSTLYTQTLTEGAYTWYIRGENATSTSKNSEIRNLVIDKTGPTASTPVFPLDGDSISIGDSITWTRNSSAISDSVFIYEDINLTQLHKKDHATATIYFITGMPVSKDYWWVLRSLDAAGNVSGNTVKRKFRLK